MTVAVHVSVHPEAGGNVPGVQLSGSAQPTVVVTVVGGPSGGSVNVVVATGTPDPGGGVVITVTVQALVQSVGGKIVVGLQSSGSGHPAVMVGVAIGGDVVSGTGVMTVTVHFVHPGSGSMV